MGTGAGRGARVALLLAVGIAATGLAACGFDGAGARDAGDGTRADYHVDEFGISVGIEVGYAEVRTVTGARLVAGDESVVASLYPMDGTDPDRQPESVRVGPGTEVLVEGTLLVACTGAHEHPVFEVDSTAGGTSVTDLVTPADAAAYERAVREWCARPVTMSEAGRSATLAGDHELRVRLSNPGPESVVVTSDAVDDGTWSWQAARVVVPAGITELTIRGQGPPECEPVRPWESGHVRADGVVIVPDPDGSAVAVAEPTAGVGC